jgi:hypothetical protein
VPIPRGMNIEQVEHEFLHLLMREPETQQLARRRNVKPIAFSTELHAALYGAIMGLLAHDEIVSVDNIVAACHCSLDTVQSVWYQPSNVNIERPIMPPEYAIRCIIDAAAARHALRINDAFRQACEDATISGDFTVAGQRLRDQLDFIRRTLAAQGDAETAAQLVERVPIDHHWLVPGMVERGNRIMVVALEGSGKSYLLRQWAVQLACGAHWTLGNFMPPGRALVIDCENDEPEIARDLRRLRPIAANMCADWEDNFAIRTVPRGLDVMQSRDEHVVTDLLDAYRPDLLVIGPLYRLTGDSKNGWERDARALQRVLEGWREQYGVALLIEHHAGKTKDENGRRSLDPLGSSAWMRWPEMALALAWNAEERSFSFGNSRAGHRGQRITPPKLVRGDRTRNEWNWIGDWQNAGGDRATLSRLCDEAMALYRDTGTAPDSGTLPGPDDWIAE